VRCTRVLRCSPGESWDLAPYRLPKYRAAHSPSKGRATMDRPILIGPDALHRPAAETPGVDRREAWADDHVWAGRSRTQGGTWSAWHVHPGYDTYVFQTEGRLRLEFGAGGTESVEGGPGDFVLIPKGLVHREGNPGTEPNEAIVFRVGEGEVLVNVVAEFGGDGRGCPLVSLPPGTGQSR
jgi:mannose-6-phosphate isomerase-like protein (cupin superfamily)